MTSDCVGILLDVNSEKKSCSFYCSGLLIPDMTSSVLLRSQRPYNSALGQHEEEKPHKQLLGDGGVYVFVSQKGEKERNHSLPPLGKKVL